MTRTTITVAWPTVPGAPGYDLFKNGTKVSSTKAATSASFSVANGDKLEIRAQAPAPPPPPSGVLTGTHWAEPADMATLAQVGYGFAVTNVAPGDVSGAKAKLDGAQAAGLKLIIGLYAFGGPEPYTLKSDGTWTIPQASIDVLNYLHSRESLVLAFFGMNEPYWEGPNGTDPCGAYSAANLRQLRTQLKAIWPTIKVYHDIGWPSQWGHGGSIWQTCIGTKYDDQTGVADYVGIWGYPFNNGGYDKAANLAIFQRESAFVINQMKALPAWLGQTFEQGSETYPTPVQLKDWNSTMRANMPPGALLSWYVWRQPDVYTDWLANHSEDWPLTVATT